jgi:hypothetical protein
MVVDADRSILVLDRCDDPETMGPLVQAAAERIGLPGAVVTALEVQIGDDEPPELSDRQRQALLALADELEDTPAARAVEATAFADAGRRLRAIVLGEV